MPGVLVTASLPVKRVRTKKIKPVEDLVCRVCHRQIIWKGNGRKPSLCPPDVEHVCACGKVVFRASHQCACGAVRPETGWSTRAEDKSRCARIEARFAEIHNQVDALVTSLGDDSEDARRSLMWLRSRLWSEVNSITNVGRLASTGQAPSTRTRAGWRGMQPALTVFHAQLAEDGVSEARVRAYSAVVRALRREQPTDVVLWVEQRCATLTSGAQRDTRSAVNRYLRSIGAPVLPASPVLPVLT